MTKAEILKRVYPSVTTFAADWRKMVREVKRYKLEKISLFLTCVDYAERQKIYRELEKTPVQEIPHVHLRHDMRERELDYLVRRYKTQVFTAHFQYYKCYAASKHLKNIYLESNRGPGLIKNLRPFKKVGGVCADLSHLFMFKKFDPDAKTMADKAIAVSRVGINHVSAILPDGRSWHQVKNIHELDYLAELPKKYFSRYICIELRNSVKEQLKFKKYIGGLLFKTWHSS